MQKVASYYLNIILVDIIALGLFLLPLLFLPFFTDPFGLPKQAVLLTVTFLGLTLWGTQSLFERRVTLRPTPLTLPLILFFAVVLISSLIPLIQSGGGIKTSLISAYPILSMIIFFFVAIHTVVKNEQTELLIMSMLGGAAVAGAFSVLNFFNIYILPYPEIQIPAFNTFGNLLHALFFFVALIPLTILAVIKMLPERKPQLAGYLIALVILASASLITVYQIISFSASGQRLTLLPQEVGLQTATGAIGQNFQTLLFGTGPGTYIADFTRFKPASFNQSELWNLRFLNSSSFLLEILATLGILGFASFLFIIYKTVRNFPGTQDPVALGLFAGAGVLFLVSLFFPLTFPTLALLFILLTLYILKSRRMEEITLTMIALPKNVSTNLLPGIIFGIFLLVSSISFYFGGTYVISDIRFQQAIVAARQNRGTETYNLQREAISIFPHRDDYYRTFSQTSLLLANSLATREGLTDQDKQTLIGLVRQSIASARTAATLSPGNVLNWENLASIYRSLIGFGDGADQYALASAQQAIRLDPSNPQLYVFVGGIFYQQKVWDQAITQFQTAISLKPDFANAYYNLGHALEEKGDLSGALTQYRIVQNLVAEIPEDKAKIDAEVEAITRRIGEIEKPVAETEPAALPQPPLGIDTPEATLPEQKPPVEIPEPPTATESAR